MIQRRIRFLLLLAPFALGGLPAPAPAAGAPPENGCMVANCHATLLKGQVVHAPTESCDSCHESVTTPHPRPGKVTFKLVQEPPALCGSCHETYGTKSHVHPPVKDGMCVTCHAPHASDQPKLLAQPLKDLCQSCHSDKGTAKHPHGPVSAGDCLSCHTPHEADGGALLVKQGDELCFGCHSDLQTLLRKKHVHPAMEGGCVACHGPHGTDHPKLLTEEGATLCFQCHSEVAETIGRSSVAHAPVKSEKGCASCHSPHASDEEKLLVGPRKDLCLGCHAATIARNMTVLHGPVKDGDCTACHDPHGASNPRLLTGSFASDAYVPYTPDQYGLCFTCHNRDLLAYPDTSFATGFRDGDRNLHFLHVNQQKGRSCKLCHAIHGGSRPRLMADDVPFGRWRLPLKFVKTETGGGCSPGCHKMLSYDRESPGRKPETSSRGGDGH